MLNNIKNFFKNFFKNNYWFIVGCFLIGLSVDMSSWLYLILSMIGIACVLIGSMVHQND